MVHLHLIEVQRDETIRENIGGIEILGTYTYQLEIKDGGLGITEDEKDALLAEMEKIQSKKED